MEALAAAQLVALASAINDALELEWEKRDRHAWRWLQLAGGRRTLGRLAGVAWGGLGWLLEGRCQWGMVDTAGF